MKIDAIYFPTLYDKRGYVTKGRGNDNNVRVAEKIELFNSSADRDVLIETKYQKFYYTGIPYVAVLNKEQEEKK